LGVAVKWWFLSGGGAIGELVMESMREEVAAGIWKGRNLNKQSAKKDRWQIVKNDVKDKCRRLGREKKI
jgi:hypothetical protein